MPNPRLSTKYKALRPVAPYLQRLRSIPVERARMRHDRNGDFIFIHINKTAGSSIVDALGVPLEHKTAQQKVDQLGRDIWDQRLTFAVVRNPWDRALSHYLHRRRTVRGELSPDSTLSFADWLEKVHNARDRTYRNHEQMFIPQYEWLHDDGGSRLVDTVIRFESLAADFEDICVRLGRPGTTLPHHKRSSRSHYRDYYGLSLIHI